MPFFGGILIPVFITRFLSSFSIMLVSGEFAACSSKSAGGDRFSSFPRGIPDIPEIMETLIQFNKEYTAELVKSSDFCIARLIACFVMITT